jgi:hypothetical protein
MEEQRTDKERADYVVEHVESDLRTNRALNGVDFSQFLAVYLTVFTGKRLFPEHGATPEFLQELAISGLGNVISNLEKKLGKPVKLSESVKAGIAISQMSDHEEIDRVDRYAASLDINAPETFQEINSLAMRYFFQ